MSETTQAILGGIVRSLIIAAGGGALLSTDQIASVAGALAVLIGVAWSAWQKHKTAAKNTATLTQAVTAAAAIDPKADTATQEAAAIVAAATAGKF